MPIRDIFKKKGESSQGAGDASQVAPTITFLRTTTNIQEVIAPPVFPGDEAQAQRHGRRFFHRERSASKSSIADKLRSRSSSSVNLPTNLPVEPSAAARGEHEQAEWERRAIFLANGNPKSRSPSPSRPHSAHGVSDAPSDVNIQEAIRLHETGDLARSTEAFSKLANPSGANNALSQVLYGLALRHGWGVAKNETRAVEYLSLAASNSAEIEKLALSAGIQKGPAKGELSLAIFELANCFRNGWGVKADPLAAKQYYETAANMGDTDAMNEVAWCYLNGFGCKKDKFKAAQYLRLADERGAPTVGNSWIFKDKYGGPKNT